MARIAGVTIPSDKRIVVSLTYIYGIGPSRAKKILKQANVDINTNSDDLTESQIVAIRSVLEGYVIEGDRRKDVTLKIKRLIDLGCYRGIRHRKGLPVRGQRSKTNARTRKGPKRAKTTRKK